MRKGRIIGSNIRTPHIELIQAADLTFYCCAYTVHGHFSADNPAIDFKPSAVERLANSRLVDGKRDNAFRIRMMKNEGIHIHPAGHAE